MQEESPSWVSILLSTQGDVRKIEFITGDPNTSKFAVTEYAWPDTTFGEG